MSPQDVGCHDTPKFLLFRIYKLHITMIFLWKATGFTFSSFYILNFTLVKRVNLH